MNRKQTQMLMIEGAATVISAVTFFSGFMAGIEHQTKTLKKHTEIVALQQELINLLGEGNREYKMTNDEFDKMIEEKIAFINMVYRDSGFKEV